MANHRKDPQLIFGDIIRRLRFDRNLSQEALAESSGLSRGFIAYIETGRRKPTIVSLLKLAHGLDVSAAMIIEELEKELQLP